MKKILKKYWLVVLITFVVGYITGWIFNLRSFGYKPVDLGTEGKTLWQYLELVGIPISLAIVAIIVEVFEGFTNRKIAQENQKLNREIVQDNQREKQLQLHIDYLSDLILKGDLQKSFEDDDIRIVARIKTKTVLDRLDYQRKGILIQFMSETKLIQKNRKDETTPYIRLHNLNFENIKLYVCSLSGAIMNGTNFSKSSLKSVYFIDSKLSDTNFQNSRLWLSRFDGANLWKADFQNADLSGVSLIGANLREANLKGAILKQANISEVIFEDATMPDGKKYDSDYHTTELLIGPIKPFTFSEKQLREKNLFILGELKTCRDKLQNELILLKKELSNFQEIHKLGDELENDVNGKKRSKIKRIKKRLIEVNRILAEKDINAAEEALYLYCIG